DEKQRLPFPTLIPFEGKPLVLAVGKLTPTGKSVLAVILEQEGTADQPGRRVLVTRTADGKTRTQRLSKSFQSNPTMMAFHDANQDGLNDLVILTPYEKVKVLVQVPNKDFEEVDVAPPGGAIEQPWLSTADVDGDGKPELLLTQKNFVRAVVLKSDASQQNSTNKGWGFTVKEQINGSANNSRLAGGGPMPNRRQSVPPAFLLDAERKALTLCERDKAGVWQVIRNLPLPLSDFAALQPIALGATNLNALAFLGLNAVAYLPLDGQVWELTELDGYETPIKDG